ncbi:MAG: hypothetical protein F4Z10_07650 [Synechococcus sp. SB0666_bin_14]|nr:hypothetical protein [Synechococcus sp. SB0666_bin_14]MYG47642.1 hypothetical protein [Synechococcus sp. SB0675_bin_6]MYJ59218.1 hypothetical protein [Synechococcus sp. SB0672_bin_6]MYK91640.1 hypothetical protein [Synechococcus sp. SB0669_bin_8]
MPDALSPSSAVVTVNACKLTGSGLQRQSKLPPSYRPKGYEEAFDADTLWYDAVQVGRRIQLVCPKLNNLASKVRSARWWVDERQVVVQRIHFYRFHDVVELQLPIYMQARTVTIEIGSWLGSSNVAQPQPQLFARLNTVVVMNRNNNLHWITDFLHFHIHDHGLQAMVMIDNDSTAYDLQDLQDKIDKADLRQRLIISAPFKFGAYDLKFYKPWSLMNGRLFYPEIYLQTALLNSLRLRYLSQARAVLNCDIDELAYTPKTTIFDLTVRSPLSFVSLAAVWRYSKSMDHNSTRHAAHHLKHCALAEPCHAKWCIAPQGPVSRLPLSWNLHWLELEQHEKSTILSLLSHRINHALNYIFKIISLSLCRDAKFYHCRNITTGWFSGRKPSPPINQLIPDPECEAALNAVFNSPHSPASS